MIDLDERQFRRLVEDAMDSLPEEFAALLDNVYVTVEDEPSIEDLEAVGADPEEGDLLGIYHGVPLEFRGEGYSALPDRVVLYRLPILWICETRADVVKEVRDTLVHELGHHFGLDDDQMPF